VACRHDDGTSGCRGLGILGDCRQIGDRLLIDAIALGQRPPSLFEKAFKDHGKPLIRAAEAAMVMRVSATSVLIVADKAAVFEDP
jgi:hypothetical protein